MSKDIDSLSERLNRLQLQRCNIIAVLESTENEISAVIEESKSETKKSIKRKSTATTSARTTPSVLDRTGKFVFEGNTVKVLKPGVFRGEVVKAVRIAGNKVSLVRCNDKSKTSWQLSHNLLRVNPKSTEQ